MVRVTAMEAPAVREAEVKEAGVAAAMLGGEKTKKKKKKKKKKKEKERKRKKQKKTKKDE